MWHATSVRCKLLFRRTVELYYQDQRTQATSGFRAFFCFNVVTMAHQKPPRKLILPFLITIIIIYPVKRTSAYKRDSRTDNGHHKNALLKHFTYTHFTCSKYCRAQIDEKIKTKMKRCENILWIPFARSGALLRDAVFCICGIVHLCSAVQRDHMMEKTLNEKNDETRKAII